MTVYFHSFSLYGLTHRLKQNLTGIQCNHCSFCAAVDTHRIFNQTCPACRVLLLMGPYGAVGLNDLNVCAIKADSVASM
jgi:hypothetical protein